MKWFLVSVLLVIGAVWCQDDILNNLQTLQENPDFENATEDVQKAIKDKCIEVGGEQAFTDLKAAKEKVEECVKSLIDAEQIKEEIDEAKKRGAMDEVFAKYCKKRPELLGCLNDFTSKMDKCLVESEKSTLNLTMNLTETLIDFSCYRDGDRLAIFIAEGGLECVTERQDGLQKCFNQSMKNMVPGDFSMESLPLLVIDEQGCQEFSKLQYCATEELKLCKDKTPANLVESLFKYIRKALPCDGRSSQTVDAGNGPRKFNDSNNSVMAVASFSLVLTLLFTRIL